MSFLQLIKKFLNETPNESQHIETPISPSNLIKNINLQEALELVQEQIFLVDKITSERKQVVVTMAMAGDFEKIAMLKDFIKQIIETNRIQISDQSSARTADLIFAKLYGLGAVQPYYEDKTIDEIRVNNIDHIFIVRQGVAHRIPESFENEEEIELVIKRMIMDDSGVSLDRSSPTIESVRLDGSRLTATCPPITSTWTFILRKHDSFEPTIENYVESKTFDQRAWFILRLLAKGRCKILFSGNPGSGKTTLMKKTLGELNDRLRTMVIGKDLEMKLQEVYPNKDIIEMEEQEHLGIMMKDLFYIGLRESPDVLVVEEFRGAGEATEAMRACTRGLPHAMATAHFSSPEEAIEGTAMFMLEEGLNLPLQLAKLRVARAFNIVVQLYGDAETGKKKIISITEIAVNEENEIIYNDLLHWQPSGDDYLGEGSWVQVNNPTENRIKDMLRSVSKTELESIDWSVPENPQTYCNNL